MENKNKVIKRIGVAAVAAAVIFFTGMNVIATDKKAETKKAEIAKPYKENIVIASKADVKTLDPQRTIDTTSNKTIRLIFNGLLSLDKDLNVQPCLAESWEAVDDTNTVFHLKKGVKFHNGDTMTAEDVKFSIDRARVSNQTAYLYKPITEVTVIDENTVKITTEKPFGPLLTNLAQTQGCIVSKRAVQEVGEENFFQHPVGTGQYKFKEWIPGDRIIVEAFDEAFQGAPKVRQITMRTITEVSNRMIALETGEADIAFDIGIMDKEAVKNNKNMEFLEVASPSSLYLGFDQTTPEYQNKKLRQAIAYAVDTKVLADAVFRGSAIAADSALPKACPAHITPTKQYDQDIKKAKQLMAEAGYKDGLNIELWVNDDGPRTDMCVIMQEQLKAIGINAEIKIFEWGAYVSRTAQPNKQLYLLSWNSTSDGDAALYALFHSTQQGLSGNRSYYKNEKLDEVLDKARYSVNQEERTKMYQEAQEILQEDIPHYTLVYPMLNVAIRKNVKDMVFRNDGYISVENMYVTNEK